MSEREKILFATAALFWIEHRQGADFDEGDFHDYVQAISLRSGIAPSPQDITDIRRILKTMVAPDDAS